VDGWVGGAARGATGNPWAVIPLIVWPHKGASRSQQQQQQSPLLRHAAEIDI
jgi:hypothetical protein